MKMTRFAMQRVRAFSFHNFVRTRVNTRTVQVFAQFASLECKYPIAGYLSVDGFCVNLLARFSLSYFCSCSCLCSAPLPFTWSFLSWICFECALTSGEFVLFVVHLRKLFRQVIVLAFHCDPVNAFACFFECSPKLHVTTNLYLYQSK